MFSKFTIRTRVGMIVVVSLLAIIGLGMTLLLQARDQFMDQLREGSVNQVQMISNALTGLQSQVQSGQLTDAEAKQQGRFLINHTMVGERNYLLLYHRLGQILAHPLRDVDSALNSEGQVRNAMQAAATTPEQRTEANGYREPTPTMTEIIHRYTGDSYTGFAENLCFPEPLFGYRFLTYTDDPLAHPQSELKTVYAELFEPWDWVIIHGLHQDDVNAQFFPWARDSAFIVMIILFALSGSALYLSRSITQPLTKAEGYMQDIARGSGDLSRRLEQDGADELSRLGASFNVFVSKLADIIRRVLTTNAEVTGKSAQFSEMIQRTAGRSASLLEETELLASSTTEFSSSLADVADGAQTSVDAAKEVNGATQKANQAVSQTKKICRKAFRVIVLDSAEGALHARSQQKSTFGTGSDS